MVRMTVSIDSPGDGDTVPVVPRIAHVKGRVGVDQFSLADATVTLTFGASDTADRVAMMLPIPHFGQWTYDGAWPEDVTDGQPLTVTATATGTYKRDSTDQVGADSASTSIGVTLDKPALRLADVVVDAPAEPASMPVDVTITGTTAGPAAAVTGVTFSIQKRTVGGGPSGSATTTDDWATWKVTTTLDSYGDYDVTVRAAATGGRSEAATLPLSVLKPFGVGDPALAFAVTTYIGALCDFAQRFVTVGGQANVLDRAALESRFRQPFAKLVTPAGHPVAVEPVNAARVAVEILRRYLTVRVPADVDQRHRGAIYEAILGGLGTSFDELRRSRLSDDQAKALALRLTVDPARLPSLTFAPDAVTDADLAGLFGLRSLTTADPYSAPVPSVALPSWQRTELHSRWREEDRLHRGAPTPLPVVDPDLVPAADLVSDTGPAADRWRERTGWLDDLSTQIATTVQQHGESAATFDLLVSTHVGAVDLTALLSRVDAGDDVSADLAALALSLPALRYLVGIRSLLTLGPVLGTDWQDTGDVLIAVRKRREYPAWRDEEVSDGIVLEPATFQVDPDGADEGALSSPWRSDRRARADWVRTLVARGTQAERLDSVLATAVAAAEAAVLPGLRDDLLDLIGQRGLPPETGSQVAERLGRELCVDLLESARLTTTRADQAAETLQNALLAVRTGSLPAGGGASWDVLPDELPATGDDPHELVFDAMWDWLSTYRTWYAAMTVFAYPENHLRPTLYTGHDLNVIPTDAFASTFLQALRAAPVTPARADVLADVYWEAAASTDPTFFGAVKAIAPLGAHHTNKQLADLRDTLRSLYTPATAHVMFELFWLVPVAIAQALQDRGHFAEALDWYEWTYAYQLPPAQRRILPQLVDEHTIHPAYALADNWPVVSSNPHEVALGRPDSYTRHTVMSIALCLLAFADSQFSRNTAEGNSAALALYRSAADLVTSPDVGTTSDPQPPVPPNPVWDSLLTRATAGLDKIRQGMNIATTALAGDESQSVLPSQYRYAVLVDRAKGLTATAQQLESAFLAAAEQRDNDAYTQLQADRDLATAGAMISVEDLKVTAAQVAVEQATTQRDKAVVQQDHFQSLLDADLLGSERDQLTYLRVAEIAEVAAAGSGLLGALAAGLSDPSKFFGGLSGALSSAAQTASLQAQLVGTEASFERRRQDWELQTALGAKDVELGEEQIRQAQVQQQIAVQERVVAGIQLAHAAAAADFLATKFTNTELFEWMSGVLSDVYAYFLQQATALAALAEAQLAFERQEPNQRIIRDNYWDAPPDTSSGTANTPDRRGLTGSARLLEDLTRLDQYAFSSDRRKLHLSQTLAVSDFAAQELQRFRQTGVLTFATGQDLFDRDFPGHYLRLTKRVKVSLIALVPPTRGIRATLSASGVSRTVVARDTFRTVTLRRDPESIAITSPVGATGLFDLEPDTGLLLPFEGMGVDTVWQLELPKAANPMDFRSIADVLLTIDYTALDSPDYRQQVLRTRGDAFSGDRSFSLRSEFPDAWYDLNNPDTVADPAARMVASLPVTVDDLPRTVVGPAVAQLTVFVLRQDGATDEITVAGIRRIAADGTRTTGTGPVTTVDGIASTRRTASGKWAPLLRTDPVGTWELQFEDTPTVRALFVDGTLTDIVLVMTIAGSTPPWP